MSYANMRITRLREYLGEAALDAFYVRSTPNIHWLTGFDDVFDEEAAHALFIDDERIVIHSDSRYGVALEHAAKGSAIRVDVVQGSHSSAFARFMAEATYRTKGGRASAAIGIEDSLPLKEYRALEASLEGDAPSRGLRETSDVIVGLRGVKDADEIARLRRAQAITDEAFAFIIGFIRPGMTERAVQIELEDHMVRAGAHGLAFSSIVATGPHAASPHAIPGDTRLEAGHAVVIDFGARFGGYCSDMTRTVFLGRPDDEVTRAYEAIREANEQVEAFLKPGVTGAEAQALAEDVLACAGFAGGMGHSLGHGVGLEVHELPVLARRNESPLEAGNVVTVEPGIYIAGKFGMRLEDFGVVTAQGFDVFTKTGHDAVII